MTKRENFERFGWRKPLKRSIDLVGSGLLLVVTSPLQGAIAIVIRIRMGRPVLFRQERAGRHGETFTLIKFRSMHSIGDSLISDDERLSRLGVLLRATSLDELPTLWNVLRGDMSLVGPRPLLVHYLPLYSAEQARRHNVRPGITGLAQVSGRNALSWDRRLSLDVHYVEHCSTMLDARIMLRTVSSVLRQTGISAEGHATMTPFTGAADKASTDSRAAGEESITDVEGVKHRQGHVSVESRNHT